MRNKGHRVLRGKLFNHLTKATPPHIYKYVLLACGIKSSYSCWIKIMIYVIREAEMCSALVTENNLCRGTIYLCTYTKLQKVQ